MLSGMNPLLDPRDYVFCSTGDAALASRLLPRAVASFREAEGMSLILEASDDARAAGFDVSTPMRRITLEVHSSLDGVGLTAAVSTALADAGIACNVVAAFHHDHLFVPAADADRALRVLEGLQARAKVGGG